MKKRFIFIPVLIIILLILYPYFINIVASVDFSAIRENKKMIRIAKEFDFERFIAYVEQNNIRDLDYSVFSDYVEENNIQLKENDVRYLFNFISEAIRKGGGGLTGGFNMNVGVKESVSISVSHTYFGFMTLPVYPNYLRTIHKIFFYFIYFLIGLFIFLCILTLKKSLVKK